MTMIGIIPRKAKSITMKTKESFEWYAHRIHNDSKTSLTYEDGTQIIIEPDSECSFLCLEMERLLESEEFAGLLPYIIAGIHQAEADEVIPVNVVKNIGTPFDVPKLEPIPERFAEELEAEGMEAVICLVGDLSFAITKQPKKPKPETDPEE